jgi:hypothetical protein
MVCYATFKTPGSFDFIFLGLPALFLALAFAFIKINEQPFSHFFVSFLFFAIHPKKRIWHHGDKATVISLTETKSQNKHVTVKQVSRSDIQNIAQSLDGRLQ